VDLAHDGTTAGVTEGGAPDAAQEAVLHDALHASLIGAKQSLEHLRLPGAVVLRLCVYTTIRIIVAYTAASHKGARASLFDPIEADAFEIEEAVKAHIGKGKGIVHVGGFARDDCVARAVKTLRSLGWKVRVHKPTTLPFAI